MKLIWNSLAVFAAVTPMLCLAGSTRTWVQSTAAEFEKGDLHGLAIRSDGRLTLAPVSREIFDAPAAYLWALARDSKGVVYAAGGPGAKVFRIDGGKSSVAAQFDALEVHALAINSRDEVFAATAPDGRIYRITASGKPIEFYNPRQKYIWAMAFDAAGNLFVATGDHGEIHRVTPDGRGSVFFKSDDSHVRSLALGKDVVYAGTDPSGLVIRVSPKGEGFVMYQMPKHEVTALALGPDGSLYAAAAGGPGAVSLQPEHPAATTSTAAMSATTGAPPPRPAAETAPAPHQAPISGGSDIYRIQKNGYPTRLWSSSRDVVYALSIDEEGLPVAATGNRGALVRIDSPTRSTVLLTLPSSQILALAPAGKGQWIGATGNVGKVYRIGPQLEKQGTWESDVFDSGAFSSWGRVVAYGDARGGTMEVQTRSGNLDRPSREWSPWSAPVSGKLGGRTNAPAARFAQARVTLKAAPDRTSPDLDSVELAYLMQNIAPVVEDIEITPANYKFPAVTPAPTTPRSPAALNLPAIGRRATASGTGLDTGLSSLAYAKGWIGARWTATDENGDPLSFVVSIRGAGEQTWKPLKDQIGDRHYSFDSTAFPDGEYRLRVVASDQPGNTRADALTGETISALFTIDNTPPRITGLRGTRTRDGMQFRWHAEDALSVVKRAEYAVDGGDWLLVDPEGKLSDSLKLEYALDVTVTPGEHTLAVRVTDDADNAAVDKLVVR
ncbi:MAG TPA: hypothetical protein DEQ47_01425 [Solibacterales bacterium]|nr:hypothetical protein [Bryobacterales bacterium]